MKGDFSRYIAVPDARVTRVLAQQGRVSLDADWNEQGAIAHELIRSVASDMVLDGGDAYRVAVPARDAGFGVVVKGGWRFDGASYMDLGHPRRFRLGGYRAFRIEADVCASAAGDIVSRISRHSDGRSHGEFALGVDDGGHVWFERLETRESSIDVEDVDEDGDVIDENEIDLYEHRSRRIRSAWPIPFDRFVRVAAGYEDGRIFITLDGELAAVDSAGRGARSHRVHLLVGAGRTDNEPSRFFTGVLDRIELHRRHREADVRIEGLVGQSGSHEGWPERVTPDLWLTRGRAYVCGTPVSLDHPVLLREQPEAPGSAVATLGGEHETMCAYIDVWERFVDAAEDATLLEPALRGADTSARARLVAQVRLAPKRDVHSMLLTSTHDRGSMRLGVQTQSMIAENSLCRVEVVQDGFPLGSTRPARVRVVDVDASSSSVRLHGEIGDERRWVAGRLIEFEENGTRTISRLTSDLRNGRVHVDVLPSRSSDEIAVREVATIQYSRDNASSAFAVKRVDVATSLVTVIGPPRGEFPLRNGDWVELGNTHSSLAGVRYAPRQITNVDSSAAPFVRVTLGGSLPTGFDASDGSGAVLRGWSPLISGGAQVASLPVALATPITLDDTFSASFGDGVYHNGDFWTFTARADGAGGSTDWPRDGAEYAMRAPLGIVHRYGLLAEIHFNRSGVAVTDLRRPFVPLGGVGRGAEANRDRVVVYERVESREEIPQLQPEPLAPQDDAPAPAAPLAMAVPSHVPRGFSILGRSGTVPHGYIDTKADVIARLAHPRWRPVTPKAPARGGAHAFAFGEHVYTIFDDGSTWRWNAREHAESSWELVSQLPGGSIDGVAFAASHREVFAIGGRSASGEPTTQVMRLDIAAGIWESCASLREPRAYASAACAAGRVFVFGGVMRSWYGRLHAVESVEEYTIGRDAWAGKWPLPERRYASTAIAHEDSVYVFGGRSGRSRFHAETFEYSLLTENWYRRASMPYASSAGRAAFLDDAVWIGGGIGRSKERDVPLMRYAPVADAWSIAPSPPRARVETGIVAVDHALFSIAGRAAAGATDLVDQYTASIAYRVFEREHDRGCGGDA